MHSTPTPARRWRLLFISSLAAAALIATGAAAAAQVDEDEPTTTTESPEPEPTEPEAPEPEPTETTEPEAPEEADEPEAADGPDDPDAARAEIEAALAEISAGIQQGSSGVERIVAHIEHGDSIVDVMTPLLDIGGHQGVTITLEDLEFESADLANSTALFRLGGSPMWEIEGYWVHDQDDWKWRTTRSAACAVMAKYGGNCDPGDGDSPWAGEQPATVTPVIPEGTNYGSPVPMECEEFAEPDGDEDSIVCFQVEAE